MASHFEPFYSKAAQSWHGSQAELQAGRFETAITLAYYACYQLGLAAHLHDGLPPDRGSKYTHGQIWRTINAWVERLGTPGLRGVVQQVYGVRVEAQYLELRHSEADAVCTINRAGEIISCLRSRLDSFAPDSTDWEN